MRKTFLILTLAVLAVASLSYFLSLEISAPERTTFSIRGERFQVEIADIPEDRSRGLSGRIGLEAYHLLSARSGLLRRANLSGGG